MLHFVRLNHHSDLTKVIKVGVLEIDMLDHITCNFHAIEIWSHFLSIKKYES